MPKKKVDAQEALDDLRAAIAHAHQRGGAATEDEMRREAAAGRPLVVKTRLKSDGRVYDPGDDIQLPASSRLIRPQFLTTRDRWDASKRETELRKLRRDAVTPLETGLHRARHARDKAAGDAAAARQALDQAQERQRAAETDIERHEAQIVAALQSIR